MENNNRGFTLIELLVVVAIIGLLSSLILVSVYNTRAKGRDTKRVSDMTQMSNALELYHDTNQGYPAGSAGVPQDVAPTFVSQIPQAPLPVDAPCDTVTNPLGGPANTYYYTPAGNSSTVGSVTVWSDYNYYFCIGNQVGTVPSGLRTLTPKGIR